jgi:small-conductance mechanosensitive channel/CRP-like cAMP-binding protein
MGELLHWPALSGQTMWGMLIVLGYPVLALAALEAARAFAADRPLAADVLRQMAYLLLPSGAVWLILRVLADMPAEAWAVRSAETAFALTGLYLLLRLAQAVLMIVIDDQTRAPKLLLDVLRIGLSLVWGAVVVSRIWNVDLGSLFAAMGVGSIVLGFALQEFLGNLLSGLGLLSAHKFGIGDWIMIDGGPARVVEMDWRTVTLVKANGDRVVVANSTLAKGNLTIAARIDEKASVTVPLVFGLDIPPEHVRAAVQEAASATPGLVAGVAVKCRVSAITGGGAGVPAGVSYSVILPVANPGIASGPRDEFLSRFWYAAQRRDLRLDAAPPADVSIMSDSDARLRMLTAAGAFHGDADALARFARDSAFRRYRRGDILLAAGTPVAEAVLVIAGTLGVSIASGESDVRIELVDAGQLLVLHETLSGGVSPVRVAADTDADVLAIPAASLRDIMEHNRVIARDVSALAEARRLAIQPLARNLRAVA